MTQAARNAPRDDARRDAHSAAPAIGHAPRGRLGALVAARANQRPCARQRIRMSAGARASAFVLGLQQRHLRMRAGDPGPEQILAVRAAPAAVNAPHRHWHLAYAPRVTLQLATGDRAPATTPPPSAPMSERIVQHDAPRLVSTLIERVLSRSERVDTLKIVEHAATVLVRHADVAEPATAAPRGAPPPVAEGRVPRVLRTDRTAAIAKTIAAAGASPPPQVPSPSRHEMSANAPASSSRTPPPIDIGQLADRVVHAIDRRLLAQRERYGRA